MSKGNTPRNVPAAAVASHRQSPSQAVASDTDLPLFSSSLEARRWQRERERTEYNLRREEVNERSYQLRRRLAAKVRGFDASTVGLDALAERLDEKPSYTGTLSRCLTRSEENRRYQIDFDAVVLLDPVLGPELLHGLAAIMGVEITVHEAVKIDPEEEHNAALKVLRNLKAAGLNVDEMMDRTLGVKPGTVKL